MGKAERGFVCKGVAEEAFNAQVDAVAGHLGGQRKIDALLMTGSDELLGGEQRGLGLAAAHWPLDDDDARRERGLGDGLLERIGIERNARFGGERGGKFRQPQFAAGPANLTEGGTSLMTSCRLGRSCFRREPFFV